MFQEERRQEILDLVEESGRVRVSNLAKRYGVSLDSIRKDLQALAREGKVKRVYGGAVALQRHDDEREGTIHRLLGGMRSATSERRAPVPDLIPSLNGEPTEGPTDAPEHPLTDTRGFVYDVDQANAGRLAVANRAYMEINDGDTVFLDISRTNAILAGIIAAGDKRLIVTTNMLDVLQRLYNVPHVTVLGTGGYLNVKLGGFVGSATVSMMEPLLFAKAFIGVGGINLDTEAVTADDIDSGSVKERVIHNASYKFLMADRQKFRRAGAFRFASLTDFDAVITDEHDPQVLRKVQRLGIPTLVS